jgi:GNAT superfamily N-acetyltransferase
VYIYDLLVDKLYRGKSYGKLLMEQVCKDNPNSTVYVMSDVDEYYAGKLGYKREGSILIVAPSPEEK